MTQDNDMEALMTNDQRCPAPRHYGHARWCLGKIKPDFCTCGHARRAAERREQTRKALIARYANLSKEPKP